MIGGLGGKLAIVTGGGQGISRAPSLKLAEDDCAVAIFGIDPKASEETSDLAAQAVDWKSAMARGIPVRHKGEPEDYAGIVGFPPPMTALSSPARLSPSPAERA